MRKAEREIKDRGALLALIGRCDTIRLAMHDEPSPYIVPLSFGYEAVGDAVFFYIHGAAVGKKHTLLAADPRVSVEGDLCHGFAETGHGSVTCLYESFIGSGTAEKLSGPEARHGLDLLMAHCGYADFPLSENERNGVTIYRLRIDTITGKHRSL